MRNKKYSILNAVEDAMQNNDKPEMQAELYLCTCNNHPFAKKYKKIVKQIAKFSSKRYKIAKKLKKRETKELKTKLNSIELKLIKLLEDKKRIINKMIKSGNTEYDANFIAKKLVARYRGGIMLKDAVNRILTKNSAYGRFLRTIYKDICPCPLWKKALRIIRRDQTRTPFEVDRKKYWNDKKITSKNEALAVENALILFILNKAVADFSEDELRKLIDEIANSIEQENRQFAAKLRKIKKAENIAQQFTKIILQGTRLSVGKRVFLNSSVKITNTMLRAIFKKGMTYPQNATFRKYLVRYLGKGKFNIYAAIILFIPDIIGLIHRRDRTNVITAIILLYNMRYENES